MVLKTNVQLIDHDINLIIEEELSPEARSAVLASFAQDSIKEAQETNRNILGRVPATRIVVDGSEGAPISSVKPDGVVFAEFELIQDVLEYIASQLQAHSPVLTGRYEKSHTLFADGEEVPPGTVIPLADEYVFINSQPYARKIERGLSSQSPEGVYQVVAVLAQRRFGNNIARITYTFRTAVGGKFIGGRAGDRSAQRNPAILVRVR